MNSHIHIRKPDQTLVTFPGPTNIIDQPGQGVHPHATPTDGPSEGPQMEGRSTHLQGESYGSQGWATIDKLTDDALLEIFDFNLKGDKDVDKWHTLVHVCRRWRNIVFASPHRLDLRLLCKNNRPVRATLDIWPVLPLVIQYYRVETWEVQDDVIAALENHDRVREISINAVPNTVWEMLAAAMRVPFPELTSLLLWSGSGDRSVPVLPDSFLGGSAPCLQSFRLEGIPFTGVQNLLLSASDLVDLELVRLPHSGYISPESMAACLSSLNRLKSFRLGFQSPLSRPGQPGPPPQTRTILPALIEFEFNGMNDYSEDFLARIDTPILNQLEILFITDLVVDISHLKQFIGRAKGLNLLKGAHLFFHSWSIRLELDDPHVLSLGVSCGGINRQLDSMALICRQLSPSLSSIERLDLFAYDTELRRKDDTESTQFLEIFQPFTAIRSLYVTDILLPFITPALQELIRESAREVLPNLRDLSLEGSAISDSIQEDIQAFIEARRLSGRPVALYHRGGSESEDGSED